MKQVMRIYDGLVNGLVIVACVALVVTTVFILYDVLSRNLGLPAVTATAAIVEYALMICAMFAAPWLVRVQGHVSLSTFTGSLPEGARKVVNFAALTVSMIAMAVLCYGSLSLAVEKLMSGEVEMRSIRIPLWLPYALMSLGFGLTSTELLRLLIIGETYTGKAAEH